MKRCPPEQPGMGEDHTGKDAGKAAAGKKKAMEPRTRARGRKSCTREELLDGVRAAAKIHGDQLSLREFVEVTGLAEMTYERFFKTWRACKKAAGLSGHQKSCKKRLTEDELMRDLHGVVQAIGGKLPTVVEMKHHGKHAMTLIGRYRFVAEIHRAYGEWLRRRDTEQFRHEAGNAADAAAAAAEPEASSALVNKAEVVTAIEEQLHDREGDSSPASNRRIYGRPIGHPEFRHAPVNEMGVVGLFCVMARELGYAIEAMHVAFPDAEVKRCVDVKRDQWERLRVEFEFESRNFLTHGHDAAACVLIICWNHNWADCPRPVLELKRHAATGP